MIILGVDPGTRITGYGIIREHRGAIEALDYGCIRPPSTELLSNRYHIIYNSLVALIEKYEPACVVVETQFMKKNFQSAIKLGMARGAAILAAKPLPVFEYAPTKAKLAVVGTGKASKVQVQEMVKRLLRLSKLPTPEDAADALALAICHAQGKNQGQEI